MDNISVAIRAKYGCDFVYIYEKNERFDNNLRCMRLLALFV